LVWLENKKKQIKGSTHTNPNRAIVTGCSSVLRLDLIVIRPNRDLHLRVYSTFRPLYTSFGIGNVCTY